MNKRYHLDKGHDTHPVLQTDSFIIFIDPKMISRSLFFAQFCDVASIILESPSGGLLVLGSMPRFALCRFFPLYSSSLNEG